MAREKQRVTVLGATGSIGTSTLDVINENRDDFELYALTAHTSVDTLFQQCVAYRPKYAVVNDADNADVLQQKLREAGCLTGVLSGPAALEEIAGADECDIVVAAIVGAAGLAPTLSAVKAGKKVLLANKESLVMAGSLFMAAVEQYGAVLLPVDSEHNAIFQCLPAPFTTLSEAGVKRIILTGSGGPFRYKPLSELQNVTPAQAVDHPNWSMGPKISVDSATMMNKGLEYIEACWLFDAKPSEVDVTVHPQSIIHSMVEYIDGSVLAQMGLPDMRTPIANCLGWPKRISSGVSSLDFLTMGTLEFSAPDFDKFRCLKLAIEAMKQGGLAPAILNAANEVAVDAFLMEQLPFLAIPAVVEETLEKMNLFEPQGLDEVINADAEARYCAQQSVVRLGGAIC